ncbi:hypothetical protein F4776DRAFT_603928 [Hypoxylon sp. NC0597]|nr:hypothetical protein F4776DRAFT_603928 [Hypoxylon sp. NC0597]
MMAMITTLLLALAPALPIISALPSEKRQIDSRDFPITKTCSGLSILQDNHNNHLHANNCDGVSNITIDLNECIGNFGGTLGYVKDDGYGDYSETCGTCSLDANAIMSCTCGQGAGKNLTVAHIDLRDCQFLWYDQIIKEFDCGDLGRACPNL